MPEHPSKQPSGQPSELWVFVYGTLKPGGRYHQRYCGEYLTESFPALVKGQLYDFPTLGYPGMTTGNGWIKGYLLKFVQAQDVCSELLRQLDCLEGYQAQAPVEINDYQRVLAPVFTLTHQPLQVAWVYQMTTAAVRAHNGRYLPNGNWQGQ